MVAWDKAKGKQNTGQRREIQRRWVGGYKFQNLLENCETLPPHPTPPRPAPGGEP